MFLLLLVYWQGSTVSCASAGNYRGAIFTFFHPYRGDTLHRRGRGEIWRERVRHSTHPQQILPLPSPSVQQWSHCDHSDQDLHVELRSCQYHLADHLILKLWLKRTDTAKGDLETNMSIKRCRVQLKTTNNFYCHQGVD